MKQIPFTLEAFGPDGLLKDGYELECSVYAPIDYVRKYGDVICVVFGDGTCERYKVEHFSKEFALYRRARTAEEIAQEYYFSPASTLFERFVKAVQAGMDEMREP